MDGKGSQMEVNVKDLKQRIQSLEIFIALDACCPCCSEYKKCAPDCTFKKDAVGYERLQRARRILKVGGKWRA